MRMERAAISRPFQLPGSLSDGARLGCAVSAVALAAAYLLANHYPPWLSFHGDAMAAAATCALMWAAWAIGTQRIPIAPATIFFFVLALVPLVQLAAGQIVFAGDAWVACLYLGCAACAVASSALATSLGGSRWPRWFAAALLAGAIVNGAIALVQPWPLDLGWLALYVAPVRPGYGSFGNLGQPNQLASLLGLGLASAFLLQGESRLGKRIALIGGLFLCVAMATTQSRTPALFLIVAVAWRLLLPRATTAGLSWRVLALFAVTWGIAFVVWPEIRDLAGTPALASLDARLHAGPRPVIWAQAMSAIAQHPLLGYGWNQISEASIVGARGHALARSTEHAHNLLLDLALWNGVPLAIAFVATAFVWLRKAAASIASREGAFGLLVMLMLVAHAMVEYPLDYLYFLVPFAIACGIVEADRSAAAVATLDRRWSVAVALACTVLMGAVAVEYLKLESAFRDMRFAVARFGQTMPAVPPPLLETPFDQLAAYHHAMLTSPRPGMSTEDLDILRKVAHRYTYAPVLYRWCLAQALNGDMPGAQETLLQLKLFYPGRPYASAKGELIDLAGQYPVLRRLDMP